MANSLDETNSTSSNINDPRTYYNNAQELGLQRRKESKIVYLRNFNNWIKSTMIGMYYFI
jgi:mRNA (guanine-N7-)-methyltransferase